MKISALLIVLFLQFTILEGTQTSLFWTYCTTDVVETGQGNFEVNSIFTVFKKEKTRSILPTEIGVEVGLFTWKEISGEAGFDFFGGMNNPLFFNAKIGMKEGKLFDKAPSWSLGIFGIGTEYHGKYKTNFNVVDFVIGKTLPDWLGIESRVFVGGFCGNKSIGKNSQGYMLGYSVNFSPAKYLDDRKYFKWNFIADYASGKNNIGGGGFAITYFFTPDVSVQTGPVWFNTNKFNGSWKWAIGIYIVFPVFDNSKKKC